MINAFKQDELKFFQAMGQTSGIADPEQWLIDALGGGATSTAGVRVNPYTALGLPAVYASVSLIAGHIGAMPMEVRRETASGEETVDSHPIIKVLNRRPNDLQTAHVFKETMMVNALLEGNARAAIIRNQVGQVMELRIMFPWSTQTRMVQGEKIHQIHFEPNYLPPGARTVYEFPDRDVLHIPGLSRDGLIGYRLVDIARDSFGINQAALDSIGYNFRNSGKPGLLIKVPNPLLRTQKEANEYLSEVKEQWQGTANRGAIGLLRAGMEAQVLPAASDETGINDLAKLSTEQVALLFGTQQMLGTGNAVYKDLQERQTAYIQNCLNKWMEKWEQECNRKLLSENERRTGRYRCHFDATGLIKGSPNALADYTSKLRAQGVISGNEARRMHGLNAVPGLDDYTNPNIATAPESDSDSNSDQESGESGRAENRYAQVHFENLIASEIRQVRYHSKRKGNFLTYLDKTYAALLDKLIASCNRFDLPLHLAENHVQASREALLEVAGLVTAENLPAAVQQITADWKNRARKFDHVEIES